MKIIENIEMKEYSNMKIGGIAKELIEIENKNEIPEIIKTRKKIFLIGNGTNTLINDGYLDISFLSLRNLNKIVIEKTEDEISFVRVESGLDFSDLISYLEDKNLTGLENMAGIPGTVGGLVNMNGGSYGTEIFDCIEEVEVVTTEGEIKTISKKDLNLKYRSTKIKENKWIVISTLFKFGKGFDKESVLDKLSQRQQKHPLDFPNLGSTFKNPDGEFAAQLISDAGLKKYTSGKIQISEKHPNFLINLGGGKFEDVLNVISHVKNVINEKYGIILDTEIIILK